MGKIGGKVIQYAKSKILSIPKRLPVLYMKKYMGVIFHPLRYFKRRKEFRRLNLDKFNDSCVNQLNETGFCKIPQLNVKLLEEIEKSVVSSLNVQESYNTTKSYWKQALNSTDLEYGSVFVEYALQREVLGIVSKYLQAVPYLSRIDLFISEGKKESYSKSQLWHKDYNDSRIVKFWTYFSDVESDEEGPFTVIPKDSSKNIRLPRFPVHKKDSDFEKYGGKFKPSKVYGKKYSSFLVDTSSCWHQGSRVAEGKIRIGLVATYLYSSSFFKYDNNIKLDKDLDNYEFLVLNKG